MAVTYPVEPNPVDRYLNECASQLIRRSKDPLILSIKKEEEELRKAGKEFIEALGVGWPYPDGDDLLLTSDVEGAKIACIGFSTLCCRSKLANDSNANLSANIYLQFSIFLKKDENYRGPLHSPDPKVKREFEEALRKNKDFTLLAVSPNEEDAESDQLKILALMKSNCKVIVLISEKENCNPVFFFSEQQNDPNFLNSFFSFLEGFQGRPLLKDTQEKIKYAIAFNCIIPFIEALPSINGLVKNEGANCSLNPLLQRIRPCLISDIPLPVFLAAQYWYLSRKPETFDKSLKASMLSFELRLMEAFSKQVPATHKQYLIINRFLYGCSLSFYKNMPGLTADPGKPNSNATKPIIFSKDQELDPDKKKLDDIKKGGAGPSSAEAKKYMEMPKSKPAIQPTGQPTSSPMPKPLTKPSTNLQANTTDKPNSSNKTIKDTNESQTLATFKPVPGTLDKKQAADPKKGSTAGVAASAKPSTSAAYAVPTEGTTQEAGSNENNPLLNGNGTDRYVNIPSDSRCRIQ